ncbi:MAG: toxic anion resistance protein [Deltaproteobacteria bacterium]|jgi:uncharacterized protein YaaN involved in tellurite resistance|nr:toxic anion resistance protein [Deltaproteobacteria bacterium]
MDDDIFTLEPSLNATSSKEESETTKAQEDTSKSAPKKEDGAPLPKPNPEADAKAANILGDFPDSLTDPLFRQQLIGKIEQIGAGEMKSAAKRSRLLSVTVAQLAQAGSSGGPVANALGKLKDALEFLDPSKVDFDKKSSFFGLFNPVKSYFNRYLDSEDNISSILSNLEKDRSGLKNDNITLALEQKKLKATMEELHSAIEVCQAVYGKLNQDLPILKEKKEEDLASFVEERLLFPVSQRLTDLQQTLLVNQQGYMAMDIIISNNQELLNGIDRTKTVTVAALNTSVTVAGSLYNQKIALKKLKDVSSAAEDYLSGTLSDGVTVSDLKDSYSQALDALEKVNRFQTQGTEKLKGTITKFIDLSKGQDIKGDTNS